MDFGKQIVEALEGVPNEIKLPVLADISKRITDWLGSGGSPEAPYIERQVEYAKKVGAIYGK